MIFLMFMINLEMSIDRLWALWRWVFGVGALQVGLSAAAIGGLAYVFGNPVERRSSSVWCWRFLRPPW